MKEHVVPKVHPFFSKERYQTALKWKQRDSCHYLKYKEPEGNFLALFDLDSTIICTKSGKSWSAKIDDWKLMPKVEDKLKEVALSGGLLAIVTNQLESAKLPSSQLKEKIGNVVKRLDIPMYVFMSSKRDYYRKPCPGMYDLLLTEIPGKFDLESSYFVGDAAGREHDHSDTDLKWALNANLKFFVPEQFFHSQETLPGFGMSYRPKEIFHNAPLIESDPETELVIIVGSPASGKSYLARTTFSSYVHINQDTLKTKTACISSCKVALLKGKSVIVDNTNPTKETRLEYLQLAKANGVKTRIIWLKFPKEWCRHLDMYRSITQEKPTLPKVVFNSYTSKLQPPSADECAVHTVEKIYCSDPDKRLLMHLV